jgi:hypothetical protein
MAQFKAFAPGVEVSGEAVLAVVEGMGAFKKTSLDTLAGHGIHDPERGHWYPQQSWLNAFQAIAERVGPATLFAIGKKIPENALWPPEIDTVEKALASIDVAYHMNHRISGVALFNPQTGQMREGIGHYGFEKTGDRKARMVCPNPYPCDFDRGIIEAVARKFKPKDSLFVTVEHDDSQPCRKKGADSCTYLVSW